MPEPTPSQTVGPFFEFGLLDRPQNRLAGDGVAGAVTVAGVVLDGEQQPVPDAMVEVWQADAAGEHPPGFGWGRAGTAPDGEYVLHAVKPGPTAAGAPHLSLLVFARGLLKPVLTRMYFPDEGAANAADPVLASLSEDERSTLVATPSPSGLRFDIRLQGHGETVFFVV